MTLVADYVYIKVKLGELNDPADGLVNEWFKYHMDEIHAELRMRIEDSTGWDKRDLNRTFNMRSDQYGSTPTSYVITGYASNIGMTEIFMEFIARIGIALRRIKPFVTGSRIEFGNGIYRELIRSPWVMTTHDRGVLLNANQKELSVRLVGKKALLANGKPGQPVFFDCGPIAHDTQIKDIWVLGEPNAVDDTVGLIRNHYVLHSTRTNEEILSAIRTKLSSKVVIVLQTDASDVNAPNQTFLWFQKPIESNHKTNAYMDEYSSVCEEFLVGNDKFNCINTTLVCPGKTLEQLLETHGPYVKYRKDWVQAAVLKGY